LAFFYYLACAAQEPTQEQYCAADFCGMADVTPCDGSVTPADAQGIMRQYLGYPEPCAKHSSGAGRAAVDWRNKPVRTGVAG